MNDNKELFWAWLAGFIDGDGSIGFYKRKFGQPQCSIQIGQKDRTILDWIVVQLGTGSVHPANYGDRIYFGLTLGSAASREVCAEIQPYLRDPGKAQRAKEAMDWDRLQPGEISNSPELDPRFKEVIDAYRAKMSSSEISVTTGIPEKTIIRWVGRAGVTRSPKQIGALRGKKMRGKKKRSKHSEKRVEALAMYRQGMNAHAISTALGVSSNCVYYWIKVEDAAHPPGGLG